MEKKMTDLRKIKAKINEFEKLLRLEKGISNIHLEKDYENFMFKLSCDFKSISILQNSLKKVLNQISKENLTPKSNFNLVKLVKTNLKEKYPKYLKIN